MKTHYRTLIPLLITGVLASTLALQAAADNRRLDRMEHMLGLNEAQVVAIQELTGDVERTARRDSREKVVALIDAGEVDAAADLSSEQARTRTYRHAERRAAMKEILTPEQFEAWSNFRGDRHPGGQRGRGKPQ